MRPEFAFDDRLGIYVPELTQEWEQYPQSEREDMLRVWEEIRGRIPDRVKDLEHVIIAKQNQLDREDHFPTSCSLNSEIAELASIINDLHIWYRVNQDVGDKPHM